MPPPAFIAHSKARIADVGAASDVVGVQDVQPAEFAVFVVYCDRAVGLPCKEIPPRTDIQSFFLGKGNAFLHNSIISGKSFSV